jgi:thiamine-phosphate pyrophosphorylase
MASVSGAHVATRDRAERARRLARARLYLVCDARPAAGRLEEVVRAAASGGVDVVQLRDKRLSDDALAPAAHAARELCARLGVLFIVNDRPELAASVGADGVHLGQDDAPVAHAREHVGEGLLIGLSTHAPAEIDRARASAAQPDYIGVGPVFATPTKPGRPSVGLELVRYAARHSPAPFFAIGGIDAANIQRVLAAGATRVAVLRAIADASDPEQAARGLREALEPPTDEPDSPNPPDGARRSFATA